MANTNFKKKVKTSSSGGYRRASIAGMAFIRIFLGAFFLFSAAAKLLLPANSGAPTVDTPGVTSTARATSLSVEPFTTEIQRDTKPNGIFIKDNVWPAYAKFLGKTVAPNARVFAWLIIVGEVLVGFLLFIGLGTRVAAFFAVILCANYLLATLHISSVSLAASAGFLAMSIAVLIAGPGFALGFDYFFAPKSSPASGGS